VPIYEYRCPKGHTFEVFHGMSEPGPTACEVCGETPLEIVLHPVAVHFKGSGFYTTDYGRGSRKRDTSKDGETSSSGSEGGDKASSESGDKGSSEKKAAEA
jgi:putative FmdB family regulatory protein